MDGEQITSNNETFTRTTYNGISILVRDSDGYVNGSKMVKDNGKIHIDRFLKKKTTQEYISFMKDGKNATLEIYYELHELYIPEVQGYYIHPDLLHLLSEWVSVEYSYKVSQLMKAINEQQHKQHITFEEQLKQTISNLQDTITKQSETITKQADHINTCAVPKNNNTKKLRILKLEGDNKYKISADSTRRKYKNEVYRYIIPASMNIKQNLKDLIGGEYVFYGELTELKSKVEEEIANAKKLMEQKTN